MYVGVRLACHQFDEWWIFGHAEAWLAADCIVTVLVSDAVAALAPGFFNNPDVVHEDNYVECDDTETMMYQISCYTPFEYLSEQGWRDFIAENSKDGAELLPDLKRDDIERFGVDFIESLQKSFIEASHIRW